MRSDSEILAIVSRVVQENTIGHPVINAQTKFADLKYLYKPNPGYSKDQNKQIEDRLAEKSSIGNLLYPILKEFTEDTKHQWFYPEYFTWEGTYKKIKNVQDVCKVIKDGYTDVELELTEVKNQEIKKANLQKQLVNVAKIDLDILLNGSPSWQEVQKFFMEEELDEESYSVQAIKTHLLTPAQNKMLSKYGLSIEDTLNGRYGSAKGEEKAVEKMYSDWNNKLGFCYFGS